MLPFDCIVALSRTSIRLSILWYEPARIVRHAMKRRLTKPNLHKMLSRFLDSWYLMRIYE